MPDCPRRCRRAARTVLLIGAALFGVGLIGVVAANLDIEEIEPLARSCSSRSS
jgi:hypothetical protein